MPINTTTTTGERSRSFVAIRRATKQSLGVQTLDVTSVIDGHDVHRSFLKDDRRVCHEVAAGRNSGLREGTILNSMEGGEVNKSVERAQRSLINYEIAVKCGSPELQQGEPRTGCVYCGWIDVVYYG